MKRGILHHLVKQGAVTVAPDGRIVPVKKKRRWAARELHAAKRQERSA